MERLQQFMRGMPGGGMNGGNSLSSDHTPLPDCSEKVHVSSLALLKMLKHGRAGVPMEVMGLMLGQFVDDYTINCVDVFAMPQSGTSVSVEAVDPVFQEALHDGLWRVDVTLVGRSAGQQRDVAIGPEGRSDPAQQR